MEYPATPCFCLNFTFNPILHNPIGLCENMFENTVVFAGSWMKKYPIRTEEQKQIFEYIYKSGLNLTIIDLNFERKERNYLYPWKYVKDVVASFTYTEIAKIYKMFPFVLNLNSVSKSSTMFANRVYDASACGSLLLSNNSKGMERLFPEVRVVKEQSDIESIKDISEKDMYSKRVKVIRDTYKKNTAYENMSYVLECAGIKVDTIVNPLVGVVISDGYTGEREYQDMFQRQTYQNKVLLSEEEWHNSLIPIDYVSFWSKEMKYEENYVEDIINGFKFTDSDYVARASENQSRHNYVGYVKDKYKTIYKLKNGKDISEQKGYLIH